MDYSPNMLAVVIAAVAQFIVGAIWYMPLFGKQWGEMHGFDKLSKKEQQEAQKKMGPWMAVQFVAGLITAYVLAHFMKVAPTTPWWHLVIWLWIGFVVMTQAGAVIFGGTDPRWVWKKIAIMAGGSIACLLSAGWVLQAMGA